MGPSRTSRYIYPTIHLSVQDEQHSPDVEVFSNPGRSQDVPRPDKTENLLDVSVLTLRSATSFMDPGNSK